MAIEDARRLPVRSAAVSIGCRCGARVRSAQLGIRRPRHACCATCGQRPWRPPDGPASRPHVARLRRSGRTPEQATGPSVMGRRWQGQRTCGGCRGWRGRTALRGAHGHRDRRSAGQPGIARRSPLKMIAGIAEPDQDQIQNEPAGAPIAIKKWMDLLERACTLASASGSMPSPSRPSVCTSLIQSVTLAGTSGHGGGRMPPGNGRRSCSRNEPGRSLWLALG